MREIKFRAWDKEHQKMYPVLDLDFRYGGYEATVWEINTYDVEGDEKGWVDETNSVLMQYTGLKDKNGKEIYEGDIVKGKDVLGEIAFGEYCQLGADTRATGFHVSTCLGITSQDVQEFDLEVIGNIYENPELLSVTQKEGE